MNERIANFIPQHWPGAGATITDGKHHWRQSTFADAMDTVKGVLVRDAFHRLNRPERAVASIAIGVYTAAQTFLEEIKS